jgi:hypothetical protein
MCSDQNRTPAAVVIESYEFMKAITINFDVFAFVTVFRRMIPGKFEVFLGVSAASLTFRPYLTREKS